MESRLANPPTRTLTRTTKRKGVELFFLDDRIAAIKQRNRVTWWTGTRLTTKTLALSKVSPMMWIGLTLSLVFVPTFAGALVIGFQAGEFNWQAAAALAVNLGLLAFTHFTEPDQTHDGVVDGDTFKELAASHPIRHLTSHNNDFVNALLTIAFDEDPNDDQTHSLLLNTAQAHTAATAYRNETALRELDTLVQQWHATTPAEKTAVLQHITTDEEGPQP